MYKSFKVGEFTDIKSPTHKVMCIAWSPDAKRVATVGTSKSVRILFHRCPITKHAAVGKCFGAMLHQNLFLKSQWNFYCREEFFIRCIVDRVANTHTVKICLKWYCLLWWAEFYDSDAVWKTVYCTWLVKVTMVDWSINNFYSVTPIQMHELNNPEGIVLLSMTTSCESIPHFYRLLIKKMSFSTFSTFSMSFQTFFAKWNSL